MPNRWADPWWTHSSPKSPKTPGSISPGIPGLRSSRQSATPGCSPGHFTLEPRSVMIAETGTLRTEEAAMDAVTPKSKHDTADTHSHVVRPADMEWKKTRFPGCEVKGLLLDRETGLVTALMRFAPGATLPDHEHVKIEQTYVLEGKLVDKEGPAEGLTVGPGEFVWREPGSRHVAWPPEGGLMLWRFQVASQFFEKDGRVTDISGADWDELWGHVFKD